MKLWYAQKNKERHTASCEAPDLLHNMIKHLYILHFQRKTYRRPDKSTGMFIDDGGLPNTEQFSTILSIEEIKNLLDVWKCNYDLRDRYTDYYNQGIKFLEEALQYPDFKITYSNKY